MNIIFLFFIFLCICVFSFFLFIRLKYPFWAIQPVFHYYDMYYWVFNVGIIRHELSIKNKFVNINNIKTLSFNSIHPNICNEIVQLIRTQYYYNKENKYYPQRENILPYFDGHNYPCYWSYYLAPQSLTNRNTNKVLSRSTVIGVITSRPLYVIIGKNPILTVYYIDYLCVHCNWRKKNIAPQLIQTHEYVQSHSNKQIQVCLFKREDELTGIVPITVYKTYCYNIDSNIDSNISTIASTIASTIVTGDKQNIYYLHNWIMNTRKWEVIIYPEITHILALIQSNNLFVKMIIIDGVICATYIFKKTCTFLSEKGEIISCIASMKGDDITNKEFIQGFQYALQSIISNKKTFFQFLTIEDISDNYLLIQEYQSKSIATSPIAYFFYNFAYHSFPSQKCFIIN